MKKTLSIFAFLLMGLGLFAQEGETAAKPKPTLDELRDSISKIVNDFFDEILDFEVAEAALQARQISNVGYGLDNALFQNGELRDTFEVLRQVLQSELFIKAAVHYDHFWTRLIERSNYSPRDAELENRYGDGLYDNRIYFDVVFTPAWDTLKMDVDAAREVGSIAWECSIDLHGVGTFRAEFSDKEMERLAGEPVSGHKYEDIGTGAKPDVNMGVMGSLGWLAEKFGYSPADDTTNVRYVRFYAPNADDRTFDAPGNALLGGNYDNTPVEGRKYLAPWQSAAGNAQTLYAHVERKDKKNGTGDTLAFKTTAGGPVSAERLNDTTYRLSLSGLATMGGQGIQATYSYTGSDGREKAVFAGQVNIAENKAQKMDLVLVEVNENTLGEPAKAVQDTLNAIYKPAGVTWTVSKQTLDVKDKVADTDNLDDGETQVLTNYTDDMNAVIDAYRKVYGKPDKNTCYLFLVGRAKSGTGKCGYMPLKRQFGFIFTKSACGSKGELKRTVAHELGHGPFRLYHTFSAHSQYVQPEGETDNLMDYSNGTRTRKYQWDLIHDPESMIALFQDEEEGAAKEAGIDVAELAIEKAKKIRQLTGGQVLGLIYVKSCPDIGNTAKVVEGANTLSIQYNSQHYFVAYYTDEKKAVSSGTSPSGASDEFNINYISGTGSDENGEALMGIISIEDVNYVTCTSYLQDNLGGWDYCDEELGEAQSDALFQSVVECLDENGLLFNERESKSELSESIQDRLDNSYTTGENIRAYIFNNAEKTYESVQSKGQEGAGDIEIEVSVLDDGSYETSVSIKEEYLNGLGIEDPELIDEIESLFNELFEKAQLNLCDKGSSPGCLPEQINFLQVLNLNLQSLATVNTIDKSMWTAGSVRGILPEYAQWLPAVGGGVDGLAEEALSIPIMCRTVGELCFEADKRAAMKQVFTMEGMSNLGKSICQDLKENMSQPDTKEYTISKASVEAMFIILAAKDIVAKGLKALLKQADDLAAELDGAPILSKHIGELVAGKSRSKIKKLYALLEDIDTKKLESILGRVDEDKVAKLLDDIADNKALKEALLETPVLVESWKLTREAIGNTTNGGFTKFALDIPTLQSVNRMSSPNSAFRQTVGTDWESALKEIINKAKVSPCSSCGTATGRSVGRSNMNEYLDNVEYFVQHGDVNLKGKTLYNWMRNGATENQLDELHQTLEVFKRDGLKPADIEGLGLQFQNGTKRYDIRKVGDKYHELKNKSFTKGGSIPSDDVSQVIDGYFKNINSLDDFVWEAKYAKLESWGSKADVLTELKKQWKTTLTNKADLMYKPIAEGGLGIEKMKTLFGADVVSPVIFKAKLNNEAFSDNALRFLKVD